MKKLPASQDLKAAVVGYGGAFNMGRAHLKEMTAAGMTPTAVAEIDPERLKVATEDFPGIETYSSVTEMLKKSSANLVTIITPHNTHAKLALLCLKAGKHVVCEKPLAITTAECDAIIDAARSRGLMASTYHNRHWDGWILRAVEKIKHEGLIGDVFRIDARMGRRGKPGDWWRTSRSISGGILYDWGVHLLEYAFQLIDSEVTEVTGFSSEGFWAPETAWKNDANEDEGAAILRFKNGAWLNLSITHLDANPRPGFLEIHGTKGNYVIDFGEYTLHRIENGVTTLERGPHYPSESQRFYDNIAAHLTKGEPLVITGEWARRPIHVLDLAARSARLGRTLPARDSLSRPVRRRK